MCGFAGVWATKGLARTELESAAARMSGQLTHRGPDDSGIWVDQDSGVAFGFRRLSIVDLSETGHQPMRSASGRYTLVYNGEVYNYKALRAELRTKGHRFRGSSDTEVVLAALEEWGVARALPRFVGMFAMALWDAKNGSLSLARDRLGIKPLFLFFRPGLVAFASELKALAKEPFFDRSLDTVAITEYLRNLYVPAPRTIYRHAVKLFPGHWTTIDDPDSPLPSPIPYWSAEQVARKGLASQLKSSEVGAVDELEHLLSEATRLRMHADVPLGALLSGGIDSSAVVALMQNAAPRPVKTFSIAFEDDEHNEAPHAARVAQHLGTDHTELMLTAQDALSLIPDMAHVFDEPYADASQIPAYLVCRLARRDVTVALSGDGGDEVFGGYNRYSYGARIIDRAIGVPKPVRRAMGLGLRSVRSRWWNGVRTSLGSTGRLGIRPDMRPERLHKLGHLFDCDSPETMYRSLLSAWQQPASLVIGGSEASSEMLRVLTTAEPRRLVDRMMLADQMTYLADDQLAKVDRVSMAVGLEVRVPLLDHRVVEFAWSLPLSLKLRDGQGKWILRQVLFRHVPSDIVQRPKMGWSIPITAWLKGPLRPWAEELLSEERLEREGILHANAVRCAWQHLLSGEGSKALGIWAVLMFQAWREHWV